jgi:hypothetical protein
VVRCADVAEQLARALIIKRRCKLGNWPTGQLVPAPDSPRAGQRYKRLPRPIPSMASPWTGMLQLRVRCGRAAVAIARGSAVRRAPTAVARRAGSLKLVDTCVYHCQNIRRRPSVPAGGAWPTGALLHLGPARLLGGASARPGLRCSNDSSLEAGAPPGTVPGQGPCQARDRVRPGTVHWHAGNACMVPAPFAGVCCQHWIQRMGPAEDGTSHLQLHSRPREPVWLN